MSRPLLRVSSLFLLLVGCTDSPVSPVRAVPPDAPSQSLSTSSSITFVSDPSWTAQNVCLNESAPANCPPGATLYGVSGGGWTADLSAIPGATWIWGLGVTGETSPAYPAEFSFSRTFNLAGVPTSGTIWVAVDDFAEVLVNGTSVGTVGSETDPAIAEPAQHALQSFDITANLVIGSNVITVRAVNGPFGCGAGPYSCNPAGVVFGGVLDYEGAGDLIDELSDAVVALGLSPKGIEMSLLAKLNAARSQLEAGHLEAACNILGAFINEVQAQSGKAISEADAASLIASAEQKMEALGCS